MYKRSQTNTNLTGLAFLSFVFGVVYMIGHTREIFNIITSFMQLDQRSYFNISNFAYCLVGIAHVLLPVAIMYPHKNMLDKKDMLKVVCYALAILYMAANLWIIEWVFKSIVSGNGSFDVAQFLKEENMMFNHMQWSSRNAETIFYNHASSMIWLMMGYYFDRNRRLVCKLLVAQMIMAYLIPMVGYYIYRGKMIPDWWLKKTVPLMVSDIIITFTLAYISTSREAWMKYICPLIMKRRRKTPEEMQNADATANTSKTDNK